MATTQELGISWVDLTKPDFGLIASEMVPTVWPLVLPVLQEKGKKWLQVVSEEEVFGWLVEGKAELWLAMQNQNLDGFLLGHWEVNARRRRYKVLFIAGDGLEKYLKQGLEKLEQYCSLLGGTELALEGRRGWSRLLRKYGYGEYAVMVRKPTAVLWRN